MSKNKGMDTHKATSLPFILSCIFLINVLLIEPYEDVLPAAEGYHDPSKAKNQFFLHFEMLLP
tara:strand:- start:2501 stop:2689 length:189 start_codon:yes stop_codon:yes gene_type:complete